WLISSLAFVFKVEP
ncbi:hypothetical protein D047_4491B, partial [Vibrio parahaemolyticus VPTS-2010_2]